jgi:hypothetical protein
VFDTVIKYNASVFAEVVPIVAGARTTGPAKELMPAVKLTTVASAN